MGNSWQGAGTLVATKLPSEYGVRTVPHPESRTPSVPSVSSRRPAASAASNTPDEFLAKVAGIWRHRWGRNGVEYVRIDANGNYYVALDDKEVRVFTLEGIQIGSTTRTVNWQKIDTGEFRPEQFPKGHRRLSEELQIDASTGDMAGRGGPDHHNVSYEKVATVPTARAMEFFKAAAGNWHLDYSTGQENIRLDVFGNYFLIDAGNRETHYFTMENVDFDPASNRVAFDKVDSGQCDARTRPKGRRHTRDEVEIAPDASTMAGSDNEGRHLTYTRIHR